MVSARFRSLERGGWPHDGRRALRLVTGLLAGGAVVAAGTLLVYPIRLEWLSFGVFAAWLAVGCAVASIEALPFPRVVPVAGLAVALAATSVGAAVAASDWGYYDYKSDPWIAGSLIAAGVGSGLALAAEQSSLPARVAVAAAASTAGTIFALIVIWIAALFSFDLPY